MCSTPPVDPIIPSPPSFSEVDLKSSPEKSEVDPINQRISALLKKRDEFLGNAFVNRNEWERLKIARAPQVDQDRVKSNLENVEKELYSTDEAIKMEFIKLDEIFARLVRDNFGVLGGKKEDRPRGEEKERKAMGDEIPKAVESVFALEHSLREYLEKEIMWLRLVKLGYLEKLLPPEVNDLVKKTLEMAKIFPDRFEKLFQSFLKQVADNAISEKNIQRLGEIYLKAALPLEHRAKVVLAELNPAARGAAGIGKAATAGFKAITRSQVVTPLGTSAQQVVLGPGAVFKQSTRRARAEENLVGQVCKFLGGSAVLSTFRMSTATPARVGASMFSSKERLRGVPFNRILFEKLKGHLTPANVEELNKYLAASEEIKEMASTQIFTERQRLAYEKCKGWKWFYTTDRGVMRRGDPSKDDRLIGFEELREIYLKEGFEIMAKMELGIGPDHDITTEPTYDDLYLALEVDYDFQKQVQKREEKVHFVPILEGDSKVAFEKCEEYRWVRTNVDGSITMSFKQLHQFIIENGLYYLSEFSAVPSGKPPAVPSRKLLLEAVNVKWKAVLPSVVVSDVDARGKAVIRRGLLKDFDTKVLVEDMRLIHDLMTKPQLLKGIMRRLSPEAEQQMILPLILQTLDLHRNNIGLRPVSTPEYEAMKNQPNFAMIHESYLSSILTETTPLSIPGGTVVTLRDYPDLLKAIQGSWEFVFFDTDMSLDESNKLQQIKISGITHHMIPFRLALLEVTEIRSKPLTKETLDLIKKEDANEANLRAWIRGDDRPIQRQLKRNPGHRLEVLSYIQGFIDRQSLAAYRKIDRDTIFETLVNGFANELSNIKNKNNVYFWRNFEDKMTSRTPKEGENLKNFARRNRIDLKKLLQLNPRIINIEEAMPRDSRVIIEDLTSDTPEAQNNRMKISRQLFPRMTSRQQKALFDRKEAQRDYINSHEQFKAFFADPLKTDLEENRAILKKYLTNPHTPIPSIDKERLLKDLSEAKDVMALRKFGSELAVITTPTILKMTEAIYPLAADAFALARELYGDVEAGQTIGSFAYTLEMQIAEARRPGYRPRAVQLAASLEARIKEANEPGSTDPPAYLK